MVKKVKKIVYDFEKSFYNSASVAQQTLFFDMTSDWIDSFFIYINYKNKFT